MFHVRVVTTGSGASAVQIIRYINRRRVVVKHVGSGRSNKELESLFSIAEEWIASHTQQTSIFSDSDDNKSISLEGYEYLGCHYNFVYEILGSLQKRIGYDFSKSSLLNDLVTMRIFEPTSKLRSIELLETYFGIKHRRQAFYEAAPQWLKLKGDIETRTVRFAQEEFEFDYTLLFYDVTTLYFETFTSDELRKQGFSKDSKSQQPQILIALMVSKEGFPIAYEVFPGNTFEGHTIIPAIISFSKKHAIENLTVVADAAMISSSNIEQLKAANLNYIVGARLGNLSKETINLIDGALLRKDEHAIRIATEHSNLICSYSEKRYKKDKHEMEKQIERAEQLIKQPSKTKKVKFIKSDNQKLELNNDLVSKTRILLGLKGYYTNLPESVLPNSEVINRYHDLYKIEQAFRISKTDLKARPIFHFKEDPIKLHILICFMALAVSKYIELKTQASIRAFLTEAKKITDGRLTETSTGKEYKIRAKTPPGMKNILDKLKLSH
jgi:transposase